MKKTFRVQKRMSSGFNFVKEDLHYCDVEEIINSITNLDTCRDGLYRVKPNYTEDEFEYTLTPLDKE